MTTSATGTSRMYFLSMKMSLFKNNNLSSSFDYLIYFRKLWPKRLRAESTYQENWPERPTPKIGRNDLRPK